MLRLVFLSLISGAQIQGGYTEKNSDAGIPEAV